jgi:hypothetical protein
MKFYSSILAIMALVLSACAVNDKDEKHVFAKTEQLAALTGIYQNRAESSKQPEPPPQYLSNILWPGEKNAANAAIDKIEVMLVNENTLRAVGMAVDGQILKSADFVRSQHFELRHGQLVIKLKPGVVGIRSGEPMLGVSTENIILGLDTQGNGKIRKQYTATGLVFAFLPMHLGIETDARFVKLK